MQRIVRSWVVVLLIGACGFGAGDAGVDPSVEIGPDVRLFGADAEQLDLGRWAVRRFEDAGLDVPAAEVHFHRGTAGCGGNVGFADSGTIDVCMARVDATARWTLMHEMSHIWLDQHVADTTEARFLAMRHLPSWNEWSDPWKLRGFEQGAEVLSWAIGERVFAPRIPENAPEQMAEAYELLTGRPLPT